MKHTEGKVECMFCDEFVNMANARYSDEYKEWACEGCLEDDNEEERGGEE